MLSITKDTEQKFRQISNSYSGFFAYFVGSKKYIFVLMFAAITSFLAMLGLFAKKMKDGYWSNDLFLIVIAGAIVGLTVGVLSLIYHSKKGRRTYFQFRDDGILIGEKIVKKEFLKKVIVSKQLKELIIYYTLGRSDSPLRTISFIITFYDDKELNVIMELIKQLSPRIHIFKYSTLLDQIRRGEVLTHDASFFE